jgi:hypothetical protein
MMKVRIWAARNQEEDFFKKLQSFFAERLLLYQMGQTEQSGYIQLCPDLLTDELHDM